MGRFDDSQFQQDAEDKKKKKSNMQLQFNLGSIIRVKEEKLVYNL